MQSRVFLITGCSRGIGLGLVSEILSKHPLDRVVATCRDPETSEGLKALQEKYPRSRLFVAALDVASEVSHEELKQALLLEGIDTIDVLFANAGVAVHPAEDQFFKCTAEDIEFTWRTNVLGSLLTMQKYSDMVLRSTYKLCVVTSSILGSIELTPVTGGSLVGYRASKTSLNMLAVTYSQDSLVRAAGGKAVCLHPGWVQTDMGSAVGPAPVTVEDSVAGCINVVDKACEVQAHAELSKHLIEPEHDAFKRKLMTDHFVFVDYTGNLMPW